MKFSPKSEAEVNMGDLWPAGTYEFEVLSAEEATSKAGNDMIKMKVRLHNDQGQTTVLFDYLMESVAYKLRHAADACGLLDRYEDGEIYPEDFIGKSGRAKIGIKKDRTGQYADQNSISDYLPAEAKTQRRTAPAAQRQHLDDDIPF